MRQRGSLEINGRQGRAYTAFEMWWHTVTHGWRSEGKTGEWSGYPVSVTWLQNTGLHEQYKPYRLMCTVRLPVVEWTDFPAILNGLVRCAERRNLVSARVPSYFKRSLPSAVFPTIHGTSFRSLSIGYRPNVLRFVMVLLAM